MACRVSGMLPLAVCMGLAACASSGPTIGAAASAPPALRNGAQLAPGLHLVGLDGTALEGLLGQPSLVRREQQAQYWRYSLGTCQLDLFLYAEPDAGPSRVVYLDTRPTGFASPERVAGCSELRRLLRGEPPAPALPTDPAPLPSV